MKLIKSDVIDSIFAMYHFANRNAKPENDLPGSVELEEWCRVYEKKLSPFLLNDLSLMVEKMIFPTIYLSHLFFNGEEIVTVEDFIDGLKLLKPEDFLTFIEAKLLRKKKEEISVAELKEILAEDGLHPGYDPSEEAELMLSFLDRPENFLERLINTYSDFCELAYKPVKKDFQNFTEKKLIWHEEQLREKRNEYLIQLGLSSFMESSHMNRETRLFFSFFADTTVSTFWNINAVVIGAATDLRILKSSARDRTNSFFACFGDPKRLEILRLTAERPWYSTELANHFDLKPATLSYHINILVDAELLLIKRGEARRFYYSLNKESIRQYLDYVSQDLLGIELDKG